MYRLSVVIFGHKLEPPVGKPSECYSDAEGSLSLLKQSAMSHENLYLINATKMLLKSPTGIGLSQPQM
jgi:hypothetical protein